jgi:hypothetical protein
MGYAVELGQELNHHLANLGRQGAQICLDAPEDRPFRPTHAAEILESGLIVLGKYGWIRNRAPELTGKLVLRGFAGGEATYIPGVAMLHAVYATDGGDLYAKRAGAQTMNMLASTILGGPPQQHFRAPPW